MLIALVAVALLIASVAAIYFILRCMGQDGVEIAAPGSCKSGRCGVRNSAGAGTGCHLEEPLPGEIDESKAVAALGREDVVAEPSGNRPG